MKSKREVVRVSGHLKEIITIEDEKGKPIHRTIEPISVEFTLRDVLQVIVGASILAIPVGFTEEAWRMGASLPFASIFLLMLIPLAFISAFSYYHYYKQTGMKEHRIEIVKRVAFTYMLAVAVVTVILGLIHQTPWITDSVLSIKRIIIVSFPASMSAAVADTIK